MPGVWEPTESHSASVCLEKETVSMIAANQTEEEAYLLAVSRFAVLHHNSKVVGSILSCYPLSTCGCGCPLRIQEQLWPDLEKCDLLANAGFVAE